MKEKLAIYPFYKGLIPLLHVDDAVNNYELKYAIIPKGWEAFDELEDERRTLICDEESFFSDDLMSNIDVLLLCKPLFRVDKSIYGRITALAEEKGKHIIYVPELKMEFKHSDLESWKCIELESTYTTKSKELASIDVPVISILGMGENCEKWDVQLKLSDYFRKEGYKVSLISSNPLSRLKGYHTIPACIDSAHLTFTQQVENINTFIKNIEQTENPDVIILGVPGGVMKYNSALPNGYGYVPFLVCNAVVPDISILSLYCGNYEETHLKEIKTTCLSRFGVNIDYFHISENVCLYNSEAKQLEYYSVNNTYLEENISYSKTDMITFNISISDSREDAFKRIMKELQDNIAAI